MCQRSNTVGFARQSKVQAAESFETIGEVELIICEFRLSFSGVINAPSHYSEGAVLAVESGEIVEHYCQTWIQSVGS